MKEFFIDMENLLTNRFNDFMNCYNEKPFRGIRLNTLKCDEETLFKVLKTKLKKTAFSPFGYYIPQDMDGIGNNPLHHAGGFYVQEPSATSAVTMLAPQKGDKVLDLCAAPGGKSTQIAQCLQGHGLLWSNEIVKSRANILLSNIERMGVRNAIVSSCHPDILCEKLTGFFDKILVDAPCSGEGMFRKEPQAITDWSREAVAACAKRQLQILNSAVKALSPGGCIVYSTCTFSKEENEDVITAFLEQNKDFTLENSNENFGENTLNYAKRIFPFNGGEGHFAAKLRHKGEVASLNLFAEKNKKTDEGILKFYDEIFTNRPFGENISVIGDKIYAKPSITVDTGGLYILRSGVLLGEIKNKRIEPSHCAFMAAKPQDCKNALKLDYDDDRVFKFLHGEEIEADTKGYTAVCIENITTGFGKASNGVLKNKYPKGLRIL